MVARLGKEWCSRSVALRSEGGTVPLPRSSYGADVNGRNYGLMEKLRALVQGELDPSK
jgi:hypothetical protein